MTRMTVDLRKVKALAAGLALLAGEVLAESGISNSAVPELVVTANRVPTPHNALGSAVPIITGEDIARRQAVTVADVLRTIPGLAVSSAGGTGRTTSVRIRGGEGYHTRLIIDGVEMSDPSAPQPQYDFGPLLAADIDRIEVVRGPQSLLYGGEAIGGVINIITGSGDGPTRIRARVEAGSYATRSMSGSAAGSLDRLSYAFGVNQFRTNGISAADAAAGNPENDPFRATTITGKFGLRLTDQWLVEAAGRALTSTVDYDGWSGGTARDDTDRMRRREISGRLTTRFALLEDRLQSALTWSDARFTRNIENGERYSFGTQTRFNGRSATLGYQGALSVAAGHRVVFGAEAQRSSSDQDGLSRRVSQRGGFADYQFTLFDALHLTLGGRLDDHQAFGRHPSYRATASYLIDASETRFHTSIGTGFRAPSLFELYAPGFGNPRLRPEESQGWDIGVEQTLFEDRVVLDLTGFHNWVSNLIQWHGTGYTNLASARTRGVEASTRIILSDSLGFDAAYTFTDGRNDDTGRPLPRRPRHQGSLGGSWKPFDRLTTDATVRLVGPQCDSATDNTLAGFMTVDLVAAYGINDHAKLTARVVNLFDRHYQEVDGYGTQGVSGFVGVTVQY